jgi:hypothetical protein
MSSNSIGWFPRAYDFSATVSQAIAGSATVLYTIAIPIFASAANGVISTATAIAGSSGYQGNHFKARPTSSTGRSGGVSVAAYPSIMDDSRASISSDTIYGGSTVRLVKAYIDNAAGTVVFEFLNTTAGATTLACRIMGTAYP